MAVTATHLETSGTTTDATSYDTGSVSLSANKLVLLCVASADAAPPETPTVTGASRTWTQVATYTPSGSRRVTMFRSLSASANSGALTIDFNSVTQSYCGWSIAEFGNVDIGGINGADAIVQAVSSSDTDAFTSGGTFTITLAAFGSTANATFGFVRASEVKAINNGTGFTELGDSAIGADGGQIESQWRNDNDTTVTWTQDPVGTSTTIGI